MYACNRPARRPKIRWSGYEIHRWQPHRYFIWLASHRFFFASNYLSIVKRDTIDGVDCYAFFFNVLIFIFNRPSPRHRQGHFSTLRILTNHELMLSHLQFFSNIYCHDICSPESNFFLISSVIFYLSTHFTFCYLNCMITTHLQM